MAEKEDNKAKKSKRPTADKRRLQDKKKQLRNRMLKSRIGTAKAAFSSAKGEEKGQCLNLLYKLIDKAVKSGHFQKNKGSRMKSKFASKANLSS